MKTPFAPLAIIFSLIVLFFGFILDFSLGQSDGSHARIIGKNYTPQQVTWIAVPDGNGNTTMQMQTYPEVFSLVFENGIEVAVSRGQWYSVHEGQECIITYRTGRWTGLHYGNTVHYISPLER